MPILIRSHDRSPIGVKVEHKSIFSTSQFHLRVTIIAHDLFQVLREMREFLPSLPGVLVQFRHDLPDLAFHSSKFVLL
jgi:hypothetical protein